MSHRDTRNGSIAISRPRVPAWLNPFELLRRYWRGGVQLRDYKALSNKTPIQQLNHTGLMLQIPLGDGRRQAEPCVTVGQYVKRGEVIGRSEQCPWVHASTSGHVVAIEPAPLADRDGSSLAVILAADGHNLAADKSPAPPPTSLTELASHCQQMGLTGLGGAGFPTSMKLAGAGDADTLLINGAECEPFITCDDRLMRERAEQVVRTASWLATLMGATTVRIGVESNKPEAIRALRLEIHLQKAPIEVRSLPHRYPAGGEPLLIKSLCGRTLAPGTLPPQIGVLVMNVATLYALGQAVFEHEPLTSRVVTLTGHVEHPGNVEAPLGTPVWALLALAQPKAGELGVQAGGPMMGRALEHTDAVMTKTSGCLIVRSRRILPPPPSASDCIRCSRCIDVCPMALRPLNLYDAHQREDNQQLQHERLRACIECGACNVVCPSHIPLRDSFRAAKQRQME